MNNFKHFINLKIYRYFHNLIRFSKKLKYKYYSFDLKIKLMFYLIRSSQLSLN